MSQTMLLSVLIMARDLASPILRAMGATGLSSINPVTAAAVALGTAIVGVGVESVKLASSFETQFARITGLTGTSATMAAWYKQKILELSPAWDMSATDAAKALYFIISAGFEGQRAIDVLNYSAKSATASLADQATVADALTSMLNAYRDANIGASQAANDLTRIEVFGKATLSSFASSLGFTMTTAHAAGIGIDEASAALATLSQVSGQHGIRRMSMEFDNLARSLLDINAIAKRAKAEGLNFDKSAFATMTFIEKLQYLQHITGALSSNINDQTYAQMLNMDATKNQLASTAALDKELDISNSNFMKLTGGAAAFIPSVVLLSGKGKEYNYILSQMATHTDIVTSAFNNMRTTTAQQWKMLEIRLQNVAIVIGAQLLPYVKMLLTVLRNGAEVLLKWIQAPGHFEMIASAVKGLAVIIGAMLIPVILSAAVAAAPFVAALAGLIAAGYLLGKAMDAISAKWHSVQAFLRDASPLALLLKSVLLALAFVVGFLLVEAFVDMAIAVWAALTPLIVAAAIPLAIIAAFTALIFVILLVITHWKQITTFLVSIWNNILVTAKNIWGAISGFFVEQWLKLVYGFQLVWQTILGFLSGIWQFIVGVAKQFVADLLGAFLWLYQHNWYFKAIVDSIVKAFRWVQTTAVAIWTLITSLLLGAWQRIALAAQVAWALIQKYIVAPIMLAWQFIVHTFETIKAWLVIKWAEIVLLAHLAWQKFYNTIIAPVQRIWTAVMSVLGGFWNKLTAWFGNLINWGLTWGKRFISMFIDGIKQGLGQVWDTVKSVGSTILKGLGFHSPPEAGPLADSDLWMGRFVKMLTTGLDTNAPQLAASALRAAGMITKGFAQLPAAKIGSASVAAQAAGLGLAGTGPASLLGGGSGETHIHLNFPNAKDSDEIRKAFDDLMSAHERANYRKARQAGYGRGLRSGI